MQHYHAKQDPQPPSTHPHPPHNLSTLHLVTCRGKRYGTTAVCALRIGSTVYVAHAGDSRAVRFLWVWHARWPPPSELAPLSALGPLPTQWCPLHPLPRPFLPNPAPPTHLLSKQVLCREGRAITLTKDHKPASVPEERERIEAQGGWQGCEQPWGQ